MDIPCQIDGITEGLRLAEALLNRTEVNAAKVDARLMRFAQAVGDDLKPLQDALEKILSADEKEMETLMRKLERDYPAMVAAVFAGEQAEAWLLRLMAAEIITEEV